ncbi:MAG: hypothetical protein MMC23_003037 [Stictis urceolatum]|nr:hypothetical protein [Stictis urceolata]
MADTNTSTPRIYLARHGETEWTINGRYTGVTDLDLTKNGVKQVQGTGKMLIGEGKLIDPSKLIKVFVSPRKRAQTTFDLLFAKEEKDRLSKAGRIEVTDEIAEWGYGEYEGLVTSQIREKRKEQGLDQERPWDIWRDGCEDGE